MQPNVKCKCCARRKSNVFWINRSKYFCL